MPLSPARIKHPSGWEVCVWDRGGQGDSAVGRPGTKWVLLGELFDLGNSKIKDSRLAFGRC